MSASDGNGIPLLTAADLANFARFGILEDLLKAAQVIRVTDAEARSNFGLTFSGDVGGIVFPYLDPLDGVRVTARLRRDRPESDADGSPQNKYICPFGDNRHLYFPPGAGTLLSDASVPVVVVESEKAALAIIALAAQSGRKMLPLATCGCWGWRGKTGIETGPNGEREETRGPLPDTERIEWKRRRVVIAFDANVASNAKVRAARQVLAETLAARGAIIFSLNLPQESGVNGPDDLIAAHGGQAFLPLLDSARPFRRIPGVLASEVKPEKVRWLWCNHIPLGKITVFDGDPGLGKTTVAFDVAARVTRKQTMPDGSKPDVSAAGVVIVSLEDGIADTIRPCLEAAGADLEKVRIIQTIAGLDGVDRTPTLPTDLPTIEMVITEMGSALLVIDPLVATLAAETNSFRDQDIRRVLAPLAALAERAGVAVIVIRHLNKSNNPNPKYRGGGSIGIIGAARASFVFGESPDEEGTFVIAPNKLNLCAKPPSLRYALKESEGVLAVTWLGETQLSARSLLAQPETQEETNACSNAKSFLLGALSDGPIDSKEIKREARDAGHSEKTLSRAKNLLGIRALKVGFGEGQHWEWSLPKMANNESLASFAKTNESKPVISTASPKVAKNVEMALFEGTNGHVRMDPDEPPRIVFADDDEVTV